MRVPERSIIYRVFAGELVEAEAVEDLSWWESSDGSCLPSAKVLVQTRSAWGAVRALITPVEESCCLDRDNLARCQVRMARNSQHR